MEGFFNIGKIVNTHGIKGEVKIYPYSDDLEQFKTYDTLWLGEEKVAVETVRIHKNMVLVKFSGYKDANAVQPLINRLVYIERSRKPDDGEGHYIVDLIGCRVETEDGACVGVLKDVIQNTSQDLYEIERQDGKGTFMLPAVDAFVREIDLAEKRIVVHLIEGIMA